jgi:hypothetical protein
MEESIEKIDRACTDRRISVRNDLPEPEGLIRRLAKGPSVDVTEEPLLWWAI